jgi:hypothetical protein
MAAIRRRTDTSLDSAVTALLSSGYVRWWQQLQHLPVSACQAGGQRRMGMWWIGSAGACLTCCTC